MAYLIDTDIIIYSLKNDENVKQKFRENQNIPKSISVIIYGELVYGAKKSKHIEKNLAVVYRIAELFPVLDIDRSIMDVFGEIKSNLERKGNIIQDMDILIAATALSHNLILVTNNVKHFEKIKDLKIENWRE
ncbi:MAG: VapC toxin family PIN domain ribonuclease [Spirochaetes bacterium]|nr:MAG: VapC toxin family PIN domain ribonuclease [Spirochaetota bacterium]